MILFLITIVITALYSFLVLYFWIAWKRIPEYKISNQPPDLKISVIVPARNEAARIEQLISSLSRQSYPEHLVEILIVDDHSDDGTAEIVQRFSHVKLITADWETTNSNKKKAIETGVKASTGDFIVTTDADCRVPEHWLAYMADLKKKSDVVFIAAPVIYETQNNLLENFQAMDFMILQGITGAVVSNNLLSMCNGANLGYDKKAFLEVSGFKGVDAIASGDDMLLMQKIEEQFPGQSGYLKSSKAVVSTEPMKTWRSFLNQRIRWASKARFYRDRSMILVLSLVYLFNLLFPVMLIAGSADSRFWLAGGALLIIKTLVEFPLFISTARFFRKKELLKYIFFFQPLHIFYTLLAGLLGLFGTYEWKGRSVK